MLQTHLICYACCTISELLRHSYRENYVKQSVTVIFLPIRIHTNLLSIDLCQILQCMNLWWKYMYLVFNEQLLHKLQKIKHSSVTCWAMYPKPNEYSVNLFKGLAECKDLFNLMHYSLRHIYRWNQEKIMQHSSFTCLVI